MKLKFVLFLSLITSICFADTFEYKVTVVTIPSDAIVIETQKAYTEIRTDESGLESRIKISSDTFTKKVYIKISSAPVNVASSVIDLANEREEANLKYSIIELNAYDFYGNKLSSDSFQKSVSISLSYLDTDNDGIIDDIWPEVQETTLKIWVLNEGTARWEVVSGTQTVETNNNKVSAWLEHFSVYCLIGQTMSALQDLSKVIVFPNPCKPGSGGKFDSEYITFKYLTEGAKIKIFTIAAELVTTFNESEGPSKYLYKWYLENYDNEKVAPGVYIYLITDNNGQKKTGRIGIVR